MGEFVKSSSSTLNPMVLKKLRATAKFTLRKFVIF